MLFETAFRDAINTKTSLYKSFRFCLLIPFLKRNCICRRYISINSDLLWGQNVGSVFSRSNRCIKYMYFLHLSPFYTDVPSGPVFSDLFICFHWPKSLTQHSQCILNPVYITHALHSLAMDLHLKGHLTQNLSYNFICCNFTVIEVTEYIRIQQEMLETYLFYSERFMFGLLSFIRTFCGSESQKASEILIYPLTDLLYLT